MATYTNTLTSHHGESRTSRADKMSGWISDIKKITARLNLDRGDSYSYAKKFTNRKRRMFLKNKKNWTKI